LGVHGFSISAQSGAFWRGCIFRAALVLSLFVSAVVQRSAYAADLDVIISEIHYNVFRTAGEATLEFVEIKNCGATRVDLSGWSFTEGLTFTFPAGAFIDPGEHLAICADVDAARATYGLTRAFGPFVGRLENNGETITLANDLGYAINRVRYDDGGPWPGRADGRGPSLEFTGRGTDNGNDSGLRWKPSTVLDGTPGAPNSRELARGERDPAPSPYIGGVINEIRHPEGGDVGFIELFNPTGDPLDLSGHQILSSAYDFAFEIPGGTVLAPGDHASFSGAAMELRIPTVNRRYLLLAEDGETIIDDLGTDVFPGRSFGRFPDGDNDSHVLDDPTPGDPNTYTEDRRLVINEIHYHPPFVAPDEACASDCGDANQWIEIHNPTGEDLDLSGWRLSSAVRFDFVGTVIGAGEFLVIANDLDAFAAENPGVANVVGPWSGRLNHAAETVVLRNEMGNPVDRVEYGDGGPINDEEPSNGEDDQTFRGSFWPRTPDGEGRTLELIHPSLSNRAAVAWRASASNGGTPGAQNSRFDSTPAPTVRDVDHSPAVPTSADTVVVTCRISSVRPLTIARVRWSVDGGGASRTESLRDDGNGVDEVAGDGKYSAEIEARQDGDVIRFAVEVEDNRGESLRVPLEPENDPYGGYPGTFYLYEVDDENGPDYGGPVYRIVMNGPDHRELGSRSRRSNVLLPATFIAYGRAYHLVGVRYRGENSRNANNRSYKVRFHAERRFLDIENLNLNAANGGAFGDSSFQEIVSSDTFRRGEVPYPLMWNVTLRFPGEVSREYDTRYIRKEALDEDFLSRYFGGSDDGFLYRPRAPNNIGRAGNLSYYGEDVDDYRAIYEKRTHEEIDDYSDIIELCRTFNRQETPDEEFVEAISALVDVRQWARFFALMGLMSNTDGGIWNRTGEDYFIYRVPFDSPRPDAGKWLLLPWDLEETFSDANEELFNSQVNSIERLFDVPEFARLYYDELRRAADGAFSRLQMRQRYGAAKQMYDEDDSFNVIDALDTNVTVRLGFVDSRSSWALEAGAVDTESEQGGVEIISEGDDWRYFKGTEQPAGEGNDWTTIGYDDGDWDAGPSGFGYGDGDDTTVLNDMEDGYSTLFLRKAFTVDDPAAVTGLTLTLDYDDAFVAYLNGTRVARSPNSPSSVVIDFDDRADSSHEASAGGFRGNDPSVIDLTGDLDLLEPGENIVAIVGLNNGVDSSDFSMIPWLSIRESGEEGGPAGGCGEHIYAQGGSVRLEGGCNPATTRSVSVGAAVANVSVISSRNGPWGGRWMLDVPLGPGTNDLTIIAHSDFDAGGEIVSSEQVSVHRVGAFDRVSGGIDGDETWTAEGGPYRVTGDVTVGGSETLTIEPGAVLLFDENASIIVRGRLDASGTADQPIRMLAYQCGENWGGLAFDQTGTADNAPLNEVRHVSIRDGSSEQGFLGCIAADISRVLIENTEIHRVPDNAIDGTFSILDIRGCHIHEIFEGVHCTDSLTRLEDTLIEGMTGNSDAIDFDGGSFGRSHVVRCTLRDSSDDGIDLGDVEVDIRDNIILGIQDKAVSIEGGGATLTGNLVATSGTGMALKNGLDVTEAWHNTVANCQEGIHLFAKDNAPDGGHGTFHSTIVWGNVENLTVDERSTAVFEFSNIDGLEEPFPGEGNIQSDPLFVAAHFMDYALQSESPCIATGREGEDMGAIPFDGNAEGRFTRADVDGDGEVKINDPIITLSFLFQAGDGPRDCLDKMDANDDGNADVSDVIYTLRFLFSGGSAIPAPFPGRGVDPTPDDNICAP